MFTEKVFAYPVLFLALSLGDGLRAQTPERLFPTETLGELFAIAIGDDGIGYAAGDCGILFRTTDGGQSWPRIASPTSQQPDGIFLHPSGEGRIALLFADNFLYRTTDGGDSWESIKPQIDGGNTGLNRVATWLKNGVILIATSTGLVFRSSDLGTTWDAVEGNFDNQLFYISAPDTTHIYLATRQGHVYHSADGGLSWVARPKVDHFLSSMGFVSPASGFFTQISGELYHTQDSGQTWNLIATDPNLGSTESYLYLNDSTWYFLTSLFLIYTENGPDGLSVVDIKDRTSQRYTDFFLRTPDSIWMVTSSMNIYLTQDRGQTQTPFLSDTYPFQLSEIAFADAGAGIATGEYSTLMITTDGGASWTGIQADLPGSHTRGLTYLGDGEWLFGSVSRGIWKVGADLEVDTSFLINDAVQELAGSPDRQTAYALLNNNGLWKSEDRGVSWTQVWERTFQGRQLTVAADGALFIAGNREELIRSTDGGASWYSIPLLTTDFINDIAFLDADHGWIMDRDSISITFDGGSTFQKARTPYNAARLILTAPGEAWVLGNNTSAGWLYHTVDTGRTWETLYSACTNTEAFTINPATGNLWLAGAHGNIEVIRGLATVTNTRQARRITTEPAMVFPNPFRETFTLRLPETLRGEVSIELFDLTGARRQTWQRPAQPQLELNPGNLPPGYYLLRAVSSEGRTFSARLIRH